MRMGIIRVHMDLKPCEPKNNAYDWLLAFNHENLLTLCFITDTIENSLYYTALYFSMLFFWEIESWKSPSGKDGLVLNY